MTGNWKLTKIMAGDLWIGALFGRGGSIVYHIRIYCMCGPVRTDVIVS